MNTDAKAKTKRVSNRHGNVMETRIVNWVMMRMAVLLPHPGLSALLACLLVRIMSVFSASGDVMVKTIALTAVMRVVVVSIFCTFCATQTVCLLIACDITAC